MNNSNKYRIQINPEYKELEAFINSIPDIFNNEGDIIHKGRNEIRLFKTEKCNLVVKSYKKPNMINKAIYELFRSSKAERSYCYAQKLLDAGIGSPKPVAFITEKNGLLFNKSFFVSIQSECPYDYYDLNKQSFARRIDILKAIALITAQMHKNGFLHKDYSGGNILFDDREELIKTEIIDLNRMEFGKIGMKKGCKNFERLVATEETLEILGEAYAKYRNFDQKECISLIKKHNISWKQ